MNEDVIKGTLKGEYDEGSGWWITIDDEDIDELLIDIERGIASAQVEMKITKFLKKVNGEYVCTLCNEKIHVLKTNKTYTGMSDAVCKCWTWKVSYNPVDDQIWWDRIYRTEQLLQSSARSTNSLE